MEIHQDMMKSQNDSDFNFEIIALFRIARIIKIEVYQMFN